MKRRSSNFVRPTRFEVTENLPSDLELEKDIGRQVTKQAGDDGDGRGEAMPLNCPVCRNDDENFIQPLCCYGDFENEIFCPHCDVSFKITLQRRKDDNFVDKLLSCLFPEKPKPKKTLAEISRDSPDDIIQIDKSPKAGVGDKATFTLRRKNHE